MTTHTISNEEFEKLYEEQVQELTNQLKQDLLIVMVGDVNAGKSSTINRLVGKEVARVGAKPGETIAIDKYPLTDKILFVDTPGLDDVNAKNSAITLNYYKNADIVLFFLNAAGTVLSETELKTLQTIEKVNKDLIIVLNKIDAADDVEKLIAYVKQHTGNKYPVCAISSRTGENLPHLQEELLTSLEGKKKDFLLASHLADKATTANRWILAAGASAGAIGAIPMPGADFVPLTTLQVGLLVKLSNLYDKPISKDRAKELVLATIVGNIGKTIFRQIVKVVPGAGSVAGGSVAAGMTIALGHAVKYAYERDMDLQPAALQPLYTSFLKKEQKK